MTTLELPIKDLFKITFYLSTRDAALTYLQGEYNNYCPHIVYHSFMHGIAERL